LELFVAIFGGVVAMKKGGKKYIIYVVSNSYVNSNFYLKVVCKHKWLMHHPPGLISSFSGGKKKSQNKNFDDHITTI